MNKIIILLALFLIPFTSASVGYEEIDYGVHYISPEAPINYSLIPTVNNTEYFDSYSVDTLWDYIKSLGNDVWYSIDNPFGYYNSTTLDLSGLVPYTGATADVDLGAFDFFAKSGDFSENVTIGEDGIQQNHLINNALLSYDTFFPVIYKQGLFNNDGNYRFEQTSGTGKYIFNRNVEIGGDLTATNLNGTNTGDQDLSPYLDTTDAATTYVPYGGANQNVDIGAYDLTATTLTDGTATITGGSLTSVKLGSLTTNGFVTTSGADGTLGIDTNTYLDTTDAATTYVPYGGANQNVDIGAYDFKATDGEFIGKLSVNAHYTSGQQLKVKDGTHSFGILSSENSSLAAGTAFALSTIIVYD